MDDFDAIILCKHTVAMLLAREPSLARAFSGDVEGLLTFPDGSIHFHGDPGLGVFDTSIRPRPDLMSRLNGAGICRSLVGFPPFTYCYLYTVEYQEALGEDGFKYGISKYVNPCQSEFQLNQLMITIGSKGSMALRKKRSLIAIVSEWAASVSEAGMFSEGPAHLVDAEARFRGRLCQFRVDVSRSGQHTLNWLTLSVLRFGYEVHPMDGVAFGEEPYLEAIFGTVRGPEMVLPVRPLP